MGQSATGPGVNTPKEHRNQHDARTLSLPDVRHEARHAGARPIKSHRAAEAETLQISTHRLLLRPEGLAKGSELAGMRGACPVTPDELHRALNVGG
jgi:hypothetical protein